MAEASDAIKGGRHHYSCQVSGGLARFWQLAPRIVMIHGALLRRQECFQLRQCLLKDAWRSGFDAPRFPGAPIQAFDLIGQDHAVDGFALALHFERIALRV